MTRFNAYLLLTDDIFEDLSVARREIIHGAGMGSLYGNGFEGIPSGKRRQKIRIYDKTWRNREKTSKICSK